MTGIAGRVKRHRNGDAAASNPMFATSIEQDRVPSANDLISSALNQGVSRSFTRELQASARPLQDMRNHSQYSSQDTLHPLPLSYGADVQCDWVRAMT